MDDVYSPYYAGIGLPYGQVLEQWREIADTLGVPSGPLRPEDPFGKDAGTCVFRRSRTIAILNALLAPATRSPCTTTSIRRGVSAFGPH